MKICVKWEEVKHTEAICPYCHKDNLYFYVANVDDTIKCDSCGEMFRFGEKENNMIEALQDNLIIEPIKEPSETPGGIILPERARNEAQFGRVEYVGPDVQHLKQHDVVVLPGWQDHTLEVNGKKYIVLAEKNISVRVS